MKKLYAQIIRFGLVGGLCFLVDLGITTGLFHLLKETVPKGVATGISGTFGFTISVIINYILSMKFVFECKEDMSRKKEFIIFLILSIIGLGINDLILFAGRAVYEGSSFLSGLCGDTAWLAASKVVATAIVMVYNFISRKIFLEKKT